MSTTPSNTPRVNTGANMWTSLLQHLPRVTTLVAMAHGARRWSATPSTLSPVEWGSPLGVTAKVALPATSCAALRGFRFGPMDSFWFPIDSQPTDSFGAPAPPVHHQRIYFKFFSFQNLQLMTIILDKSMKPFSFVNLVSVVCHRFI